MPKIYNNFLCQIITRFSKCTALPNCKDDNLLPALDWPWLAYTVQSHSYGVQHVAYIYLVCTASCERYVHCTITHKTAMHCPLTPECSAPTQHPIPKHCTHPAGFPYQSALLCIVTLQSCLAWIWIISIYDFLQHQYFPSAATSGRPSVNMICHASPVPPL